MTIHTGNKQSFKHYLTLVTFETFDARILTSNNRLEGSKVLDLLWWFQLSPANRLLGAKVIHPVRDLKIEFPKD
ncbi:hypothetical protein AFLA_014114 [Aspergillus flavus NRRL3357]|nr:hypothetical protein AFLA_014114 [Aspergillus flavus NRRL3357]